VIAYMAHWAKLKWSDRRASGLHWMRRESSESSLVEAMFFLDADLAGYLYTP
jgi:hypothetical protein